MKTAFLYSKWGPPKKTMTGHNAKINGSCEAQPQWKHLNHSSCISSSGNITEKGGRKTLKAKVTRKSIVKVSLKKRLIKKTRTMTILMDI